jgi:hypothetical protein
VYVNLLGAVQLGGLIISWSEGGLERKKRLSTLGAPFNTGDTPAYGNGVEGIEPDEQVRGGVGELEGGIAGLDVAVRRDASFLSSNSFTSQSGTGIF